MKKFISLLLSALLVFALVACAKDKEEDHGQEGSGETDIVLAQDGRTDYIAVIPDGATEAVRYAADELVNNFADATGAQISVVTDAGRSFNSEDKVISIGETTIKEGSGLTVSVEELTEDGYKIERYGNTVVICGGDDSGTAFGVYEFLTQQFHYEIYAFDEIYIDDADTAYLKDLHIADRPSFEYRDTDGLTDYNHEFAYRLRLRKWNSSEAQYDYSASKDWIGGHCHTFYTFIPKDKYYNEHKEWFSGNQLCLTNEEMKAEFIKNAIQMIKDNPDGKYVNIAEEDFAGFCNCQNCTDERSAYGMSGYIIRFVNDIIAGIEEWKEEEQPDRELKYATFAYSSGSFNPPVRQTETGEYEPVDLSVIPDERLYIRLGPIDYCYSHALTDESCSVNVASAKAIAGWRAITDRFMVWDYDVNYNHYFMFFDLYDALQKNLSDYYDMGVIGIMRQSSTGSRVSSMCDLKTYLNAKLMWDVHEDTEALINDFMDHFYKDGAPYMKQYLNMMRSYLNYQDETRQGGLHYQLYDRLQPSLSTAQLWPKRILEQAMELFEQAYAAYDKMEDKELAQILHNRVLKESVCVRYVILKNYGSYYNINDPTYREMIEEFRADVTTVEAFNYREGADTSAWLDTL